MNSYERMINLFSGKPVDRLPAQPLCMTFAAQLAGVKYYDYVTDYRVLVEAQLKLYEKFGFDIMSLCSDPCREAVDCGADIKWFENQPPTSNPDNSLLKDKNKLLGLKQPNPLSKGQMYDRVKGAKLFREKVGNEIPILGWIEGPMSEGSDLRGFEIMMDFIDDPKFVIDLFEFVTEMEINFAKAQINAGVDIIGIGDAAASLVSADTYHEYILPYEKRIIDAIHEMGCFVRLHICGNINHLLKDINSLNIDMIDIDFLTNLHLTKDILNPNIAILGNINPVKYFLESTAKDVYNGLFECHQIVGDKYIIGPGCEIPPESKYENVQAIMEYAHSTQQKIN
ncbi:MAG: uroporphyrinogen decarboxylase family protein [bacterium]